LHLLSSNLLAPQSKKLVLIKYITVVVFIGGAIISGKAKGMIMHQFRDRSDAGFCNVKALQVAHLFVGFRLGSG
jgi:hypothetical protein